MTNALLRALHGAFNDPDLRRVALRLRVPLGALSMMLLLTDAAPDWLLPGVIIALAGEAIQVWSFGCLRKNEALATGGPYALVRNPMYIGRYLMLFGVLMLAAHVWGLVCFTVAYWLYAVNRVGREEVVLRRTFGAEYDRYCAAVGRFVPSVRSGLGRRLLQFDWALCMRNRAYESALGLAAFLVAACLWVHVAYGCLL